MKKLRITVEGKAYDVTVEVLDANAPAPIAAPVSVAAPAVTPMAASSTPAPVAAGVGDVVSPMSGNVTKVVVQVGATVNSGDLLVWLEAMKMETPIYAPSAGKIAQISVKQGDTVHEGQPLVKIA